MTDPTNPSPDDPTKSRVILRHDLLRRLRRVAALRSVVAMASWVVIAILLSAIATLAGITPNNGITPNTGVFLTAAFFGIALLISWVLTQVLCKPLVRCPCCDASLWQCGTGNFKPRRMRIRPDATACPSCGAKFV